MGVARASRPAVGAAVAVAFLLSRMAGPFGATNDSFHYVDLARSLAQGEGPVHHTLGYNERRFPTELADGAPERSQPPGYALAVALLHALGLPWLAAAWTVSLLCGAGAILVAGSWCRRLGGSLAALGATAVLVAAPAVRTTSVMALSDALGALCWTLSLASLASWIRRGRQGEARRLHLVAAAAVAAGLASGVRYALWCTPVLGLATVLCAARGKQERRDAGWLFAVTAAPIPVLLLLWNLVTGPTLLGAERLPSEQSLGAVLAATARALGASFGLPGGLALLALGVAAVVRNRGRPSADPLLLLPVVWGTAYLAILVTLRWRLHFDSPDPRLLLPATLALACTLAAGWMRSLASSSRRRAAAGFLALLLAASPWPRPRVSTLELGETVRWAAAHLPPEALLLGEDTVDYTCLSGRTAYSFSPYPYSERVDRSRVLLLARNLAREERWLALLLRRPPRRPRAAIDHAYGPWIAALMDPGTSEPPELQKLFEGPDGVVYRVAPESSLAAADRD